MLSRPGHQSGVARGLLQGRPLQLPTGRGVGAELTKSWPTFEQVCVTKSCPAISCCFSPTSAYKTRLARSWPRVGHGLPTLTRTFPCWNCRGRSCSSPLATPKLIIEFLRGCPRRGDNFISLLQVLQTLYSKRQKTPFFLPKELQPRQGRGVPSDGLRRYGLSILKT